MELRQNKWCYTHAISNWITWTVWLIIRLHVCNVIEYWLNICIYVNDFEINCYSLTFCSGKNLCYELMIIFESKYFYQKDILLFVCVFVQQTVFSLVCQAPYYKFIRNSKVYLKILNLSKWLLRYPDTIKVALCANEERLYVNSWNSK